MIRILDGVMYDESRWRELLAGIHNENRKENRTLKTFEFASTSTPGQKHIVTLANGELICSCRGFRTPNRCWHVRDVAQKEGLNISYETNPIENSITGFMAKAVPKQESLLESAKPIPIEPMLARGLKDDEYVSDFSASDFVLEEKYNGHRIILEIGPEITAWSRAGNIRMLPSHILKELQLMSYGIYDSELYIPGGQSTDTTALKLQHKLELALFDIMQVAGHPATDKPLYYRRELLETSIELIAGSKVVYLSDQFDPSEMRLQQIWNRGGEGAILKRRDSLYEINKRSKAWIKFKKEETEVAKIVGFEEGLLGPHSKVVGVDKDGVEVHVKTLNDEWRARLDKEGGQKYIGWNLRFKHQGRTRDKRKYTHPMMDHIFEGE